MQLEDIAPPDTKRLKLDETDKSWFYLVHVL